MKYLKMFESYKSESEVAKICKKYDIKNWSLDRLNFFLGKSVDQL